VVTGGQLTVTTPAELTSIVVGGGLAELSNQDAVADGGSLIVGGGTSAFGGVTVANVTVANVARASAASGNSTPATTSPAPLRPAVATAAGSASPVQPLAVQPVDVAIAIDLLSKGAASAAWTAANATSSPRLPAAAAAHDRVLQDGVRAAAAVELPWL
jgi:hypothetical protein